MLLASIVLLRGATSFIVGGCIGPKSVLERYLNAEQKAKLRRIVHTTFDGRNAEQVLASANTYVNSVVTAQQWSSILPELRNYQAMKKECSIYAQLLPTKIYTQLLRSVWIATEHGADAHHLKRLVEDFIDRSMKAEATNTP
ncbi:unnamed protein product [Nippostrongylus brasiliensis]|uniref:F-type H+-transporting ATPase subunit b n=1 Tax=Nippostrongylus brasiliensis TaxID=27835 RepID=A0A0N4YSL0_NIPBR|nr:unnamed protein product [Nippostrongylus brasiliensis]